LTAENRMCGSCGEEKSLSAFSKDKKGKGGLSSKCKECAKEATRLWKLANPEQARLAVKNCFNRNRQQYYSSHNERQLLVKYGLTKEAYVTLVQNCGDICPICGREFGVTAYTKPVIDHCHTSGKVRGLICRQCNIGLGAFKDNIKSMKNAIEYLKENNDQRD